MAALWLERQFHLTGSPEFSGAGECHPFTKIQADPSLSGTRPVGYLPAASDVSRRAKFHPAGALHEGRFQRDSPDRKGTFVQ
jgi:hypothetical protein